MSSWDGPAEATPAILIHGTLSWAARAFERQRPLARARRVLLPDRRGFGASPDLRDADVTSDYVVDAEDVLGLLAGGAHLVGHSYGATVATVAAAARPDQVRSLTLIEPCAHGLASDDPVVAGAVQDARRFMSEARRRPAEDYLDQVYGDRPRPEPASWLLRAAHTALHERPCWLAELTTAPLAAARRVRRCAGRSRGRDATRRPDSAAGWGICVSLGRGLLRVVLLLWRIRVAVGRK
ncbi:alpha/beta fold hydrolase [Plantactinospora siamensis]|uniref:Alpha/beta fold hydrolase n=1 Tax=Plantactinospora siamensis TaxID=555372 RepID=A0ABV6NY79_9ACTN